MKSNPLFHDSTVTQGANVQTQFELTRVKLKNKQVLCLKLIIGNDIRYIEMNLKQEGVFHASAWIQHRKHISYQFFIQIGGEPLYASKLKKSLALHTVSEVWEPLSDTDWKRDFQKIPDIERKKLNFVGTQKITPQETYLDNLIEKWDL